MFYMSCVTGDAGKSDGLPGVTDGVPGTETREVVPEPNGDGLAGADHGPGGEDVKDGDGSQQDAAAPAAASTFPGLGESHSSDASHVGSDSDSYSDSDSDQDDMSDDCTEGGATRMGTRASRKRRSGESKDKEGKGRKKKKKKKRAGQFAEAGKGAPGHARGNLYTRCPCKGSAVVLYSPFDRCFILQVDRSAHGPTHPDVKRCMTDIPLVEGTLVDNAVR